MGQLPSSRVTPSNIFTIMGLDYAGLLVIKRGNPRKPVLVKAYLCVFVDFAVKAVHLEIVSDMTSEAFLAALKRFVSRRGRPRELHSDNGTNFVGANRELQDLCSVLNLKETQESICHYCLSNNIEWHFSPERAPNFGGLWEAVVKAAKTHLRKLMGTQKFTNEELATIVTQIEACLNSRPLTLINCADEDGLDVLTPGHFLIGRPLEAVPDQMDRPQTPSLLKRWNLCHAMAREFWYRWSSEYIRHLNKNNKWRRNQRNMQVNDTVLVKDQTTFTNTWPLGRIVQTYPGVDGRVRVMTVKTLTGEFKGPVSKLVLLLSEETENDHSPSSGAGMLEPASN